MDYDKVAQVLKAMADPKRVKIIDLLSCGTLCACDVLEHFDVTQPTLSHHMKILEQANIISVRKEGQWHYYTLRDEFKEQFINQMNQLFTANNDCICHQTKEKE